jgi:hypothetical protein
MAAGAFCALPGVSVAQDKPPLLGSLGQFFRDLAETQNPTLKAQHDYDRAVAAYKTCLAANPAPACEGQRHVMDTAATIAAGFGSSSNIYIGR